jgi:Uma2 family endonuclease
MPWQDPDTIPPTNLPDDDGDKMESPWHFGNAALLVANYVAARGGRRADYYIGANMFVYYSLEQLKNRDFKGPDVFIVHEVDGTRERRYWATWEEDGRTPDVIVELLSASTRQDDLGEKKRLYERHFHTAEYFCVGYNVEEVLGWRLQRTHYQAIAADERGWLWSEELGLWLGAWQGLFLGLQHTWLRFYHRDGSLVLLPEEAERQRADAEQQRADTAEAHLRAERQRIQALEAELARLKAQGGAASSEEHDS